MTDQRSTPHLAWIIAIVLLASSPARAIEDRADIEPNEPARADRSIDWKLTPSVYNESAGHSAADLNLRGNREKDVFWIGKYQRGDEFVQTRAGYERQFSLPLGKLIASGQLASRGFVGASATFEFSDSNKTPYFGLLGLGRTNRRPYYNLNFDPNDSTLIGAGWRPNESTATTLYQIRDDRLGTGQRVTHLVVRGKTGERSRLTVDLFQRAGRADPDAESFRATGVTLTYDQEPWFIRVAWDPKANFTASNMTRLAIGARF